MLDKCMFYYTFIFKFTRKGNSVLRALLFYNNFDYMENTELQKYFEFKNNIL